MINMRKNVDFSEELKKLAHEDALAAKACAQAGLFRPACYFVVQSMEKEIRSKIFQLVSANNKEHREQNKNHSVDSAMNLLIEILGAGDLTKIKHIQQLAKENALGNENYRTLHNKLRYPYYIEKYEFYSMLDVRRSDFVELENRLDLLRKFLKDIHLVSNYSAFFKLK